MNKTLKALVIAAPMLGSTSISHAKVTYLHANPLGSMIAATDESGAQVWIKRYSPFGIESRLGEVQDSGSNQGFSTHELDTETSLLYMKARYYDPLVGRFYSQDPIGFQESKVVTFNYYMYAANNSLMFIDPDGQDFVYLGIDMHFLGFGAGAGVFLTYPGAFQEPWDIGLYNSPVISQPGWLDALLPGPDPVGGRGFLVDTSDKGFSIAKSTIQFGAEYTRNYFNGKSADGCLQLVSFGGCGSFNMLEKDVDIDNYFSGASFSYGPQFGYDVSVSYNQTYSVRDAWSSYESAVDSMFDSTDWYSGGDYGSGGSYYSY